MRASSTGQEIMGAGCAAGQKNQRRALGRAVSRLIDAIDPAYLHPCDIFPLPTLILGGGRPKH